MENSAVLKQEGLQAIRTGHMTNVSMAALLILIACVMSACAITNSYGPYMGKVIDKDTKEPLEEAVVFIQFNTERPGPAGGVGYYADSVEVLTDGNGEFHIPAYRVLTFAPFQFWEPHGMVLIFKPGYGFYPGGKGSGPFFWPDYTIPENRHVTIKLQKLLSIVERSNNLNGSNPTADVPIVKIQNIIRLKNIERVAIGLPPLQNP